MTRHSAMCSAYSLLVLDRQGMHPDRCMCPLLIDQDAEYATYVVFDYPFKNSYLSRFSSLKEYNNVRINFLREPECIA